MAPTDADSLPESLYSADAVREMDRYIIEEQGVSGFGLMQTAARAAFRRMVRHWPEPGPLLVLCGAGNNGGDGYLVAANAKRHGMAVQCIAVADTGKLKGDARKAWEKAETEGVPVIPLAELGEGELAQMCRNSGLIVDAMLGTGVTGAPREPFATVIAQCNGSGRPVMAVDLPSGLNATTGAAEGEVIRADVTVTFIALKAGLYTGQGSDACGRVVFDALDTEQWQPDCGQTPLARRRGWGDVSRHFPRRPRNAHKGQFGHVLIIAGNRGFGGAGLMAAEAAARTGAGMVTLATYPDHVVPALARCPSLMVRGVSHGNELDALLEKADCVVCGPGLGQDAWAKQMLQRALGANLPLVLDADALNLLGAEGSVPGDRHILTPHPGEAARLLGCSVAEIEQDRIAAAERLWRKTGGVVLLKGAGTIVYSDNGAAIVDGSNPGMATGGMGDVLSGMIGALVSQVSGLSEAAEVAAVLHLAAADLASLEKGYMGLLPTDVIACIPDRLAEAEGVSCRNAT